MIEGAFSGSYFDNGVHMTGDITLVAGKTYLIETDIRLARGAQGLVTGYFGVVTPGYVVPVLLNASGPTVPVVRLVFVATQNATLVTGTIVCRFLAL